MLESLGAGKPQDRHEYFNRYARFFRVKDGLTFAIREYMDSHYVATLFGFKWRRADAHDRHLQLDLLDLPPASCFE